MKIQISENSRSALDTNDRYELELRGQIEVKASLFVSCIQHLHDFGIVHADLCNVIANKRDVYDDVCWYQ